jgi:putative endonuclease
MVRKGSRGEEAAARYLRGQGYSIVARNFRCRWGEVDLVAARPEELVFVEVKCWDRLGKESLEQSIGARKQARIRRTAEHFLYEHPAWEGSRIRFDVILVRLDPPEVDHLAGAF